MKMKTRTKIVTSIIAIVLSVAIIFATCYTVGRTTVVNTASVRTVELTKSNFDDQSIFDEFDEHTLTTEGNVTYFEGFKTLDADILSEINLISEQNLDGYNDSQLRYALSFDSETNYITASATITKDDGSVEYDEISGLAFVNEQGETDAYMNLDGEMVLLSEMRGAGLIENCGWLSRLIKTVATGIVAGLTSTFIGVVAVVAVTIAENQIAASNKSHNNNLPEPDKYINGQDYYSSWKFGARTVNYNGCGPIAVYNTMRKVNKKQRFADVIYELEKHSGTLFMGAAGADPSHLAEYFKKHGVAHKSYLSLSSIQAAMSKMNDKQMAIICFWTDTACTNAHYVAVERVIENNVSKYNIYNYVNDDLDFKTVSIFDKSYMIGNMIMGYICG